MSSSPASVFEAISAYLLEAPTYHVALEAVLVTCILYLIFSKSYRPETKHDKLTKEEEDQLIAEWEPEPLVPTEHPSDREVDPAPIVTGTAGVHITVNGKECINLATFNFLGFLGNTAIKDAAARSIDKYGVGSCGPRGFYGTVDVHLELEDKLAKFTGKEEAILYSYGFAAISSAIPAYSKRRDIIFCDNAVCFPIQKGLLASRSKIKYFRHNDMDHLQELLEESKKMDEKNPAKAKVTRKFIVAEALYFNSGDLCPLPKLVELRNKYRVPIFLEESLSFGVLGKTGRGATEHFNVPSEDVDIMCVSLEMAMAGVGGFCAGKSYVIDHQRLSGLGYCFSASVPPLLASAAMQSLRVMQDQPDIFEKIRNNAKSLRRKLKDCAGMKVGGDDLCPVIYLCLSEPGTSREKDERLLQTVADECLEKGVAMATSKYLKEEVKAPPPSLRLTVSCDHGEVELSDAAQVIKETCSKHFPAARS